MFFFTYDLKHIYLEVNNLLDSSLKKKSPKKFRAIYIRRYLEPVYYYFKTKHNVFTNQVKKEKLETY